MRQGKFVVFGLLVLIMVCVAGDTVAVGPANVIHQDGGCSIGWFGCSSDDAIMLPDGSYTCEFADIDLVYIEASYHIVESNDEHGNVMSTCRTQIAFGQLNPEGGFGGGGEVVAIPLETICLFLPDACQANGAFIANPRTVGSLAVCLVGGVPTTNMQETVTPSGNVTLKCFLPDPPQGE
jgi:hypothetical protein